jgi:CheY-like chemotaxis protein
MPRREKSPNILVVEDEPDIRSSLRQALEWEGYAVVEAENGREGVEKLSTMPTPCLILLDLMMPVMNGWEFAQALKGDMALATIPVVVVTAFAERGLDRLGARGVVKKPVDLDRLLAVVKEHCGSC